MTNQHSDGFGNLSKMLSILRRRQKPLSASKLSSLTLRLRFGTQAAFFEAMIWQRSSLADQIANLVDFVSSTGANPDAYANILDNVKTQIASKEKVSRNRKLGLFIQAIVQKKLDDEDFHVEVIDHGYDLKAYLEGEAELESDVTRLEVGALFIEVKTTSRDEVKMTPTQASFAVEHKEKYSLCVVDLTQVDMPPDFNLLVPEMVEPAITMTDNIGYILCDAHQRVQSAEMSSEEIRIDNTKQLRYCVQRKVWEHAASLRVWIEKQRQNF
ncbi:MAG: protein NO VEIN domain-containing protein [Limisphaerales bacterium]